MRFAAYAALLASLFLWAGNWIVGRAVREEISPAIATLGRIAIVLLTLAPFALQGMREKWQRVGRADRQNIIVAGLFGGGIHLAMQWLGFRYTTATSATLFISTSPIFILVLARLLLGERARAVQWAGVGVSFVGVACIATEGAPAALTELAVNAGDVLALASMMMWAAYTIAVKRRRDPLDARQFLFLVALVGGLSLVPWVAWELVHDARASLSAAGAAAFVYSGVGSFVLAYLGWGYAVARLGAARAGAWMHLMPAFGVLLAATFLGERPRLYHLVGIALILAGVTLSSLSARAETHR